MRFLSLTLPPRLAARAAAAANERRRIAASTASRERDVRIDLFRGLALWFIFLDHVPSNVIGHFTLRNFGFSDATEIFVFVSGFSAALAYGRSERKLGFVYMTAHVWRRCWQLYVAHLILFLFYTAQIAWLAARFSNSMYVEELNMTRFIEAPHIALLEALTLRFRPANLDILPLYIVLLFAFPFVYRALRAAPIPTLLGSLALYLCARFLEWNLPTSVPDVGWYFNPFAWQLLFYIGVSCAMSPERLRPLWKWRPWLGAFAAAYLVFGALLVMGWEYAPLGDALNAALPQWWFDWLYPVDKTNLDVVRLTHFLALAYLVAHLVSRDARFLRSAWLRPLVACGRQSLYVFCLGVFLSFAAHFVLVELNPRWPAQLGVSLAGIASMTLLAMLLNWYRAREAAAATRPPTRTANG